jgi:hypothetical protein
MMTEQFTTNMETLARRHGRVHAAVLEAGDDPCIRVTGARSGGPVPEVVLEGGAFPYTVNMIRSGRPRDSSTASIRPPSIYS